MSLGSLIVIGLFFAGMYLLLKWLEKNDNPHMTAILTAYFVVGILCIVGWREVDPAERGVGAYCAYGSVSQAQFERCTKEVDEETAYSYQTEAGEFARGERDDCGPESGPLCRAMLESPE